MTRQHTRRTVLKATTALVGSGFAGVTAGQRGHGRGQSDDELRLFGEQAVAGTTEVVTQGTYAYVATDQGLAVVDWRNPGQPELVVDMEVPGVGVWDVKVDGDLLAISSQGAEDHDHEDGEEDEDGGPPEDEIGTHFYDVSDPTDPQFRGTWTELPAGVHNHFLDGDVAYICREAPFDDSALKIVDASDPTNPTLLSEWRVEDVHPELDQPTNFLHDVYVQDDYAYLAYWDAGTRILDVSDPTDPVEVSAMGEAPDATEDVDYPSAEWVARAFLPPGNSHYVQPTPDGDYVLQGAETFPGSAGVDDPDNDDYGGIKVFDVTDFNDPELVTRIDPPDADVFRTSHNFDVTANRLHTSWYDGGIRVFDFTDPANPEELASYRTDDTSFWTAVQARSFTIGGDSDGGVVFLHNDRGTRGSPDFDGDSTVGRGPMPSGQD